nr:glycoside hydrolase family 78 protein [Cohnella lubricantis]
MTVSVSADSRYRLYLNGESVSSGPCKGDLNTHYYETVDVTDRLHSGTNMLAAFVVHYPAADWGRGVSRGPTSVWRTDRGGYLLEGTLERGDGEPIECLNTDAGWEALRLPVEAFSLKPETLTLFIGGGEKVDARRLPHGWLRKQDEGAGWAPAIIVSDPYDPLHGELTRWQLMPRPIPLAEETNEAFVRVSRSSLGSAIAAADAPIGELGPIVVQPGERVWLEVDAGELVAGYPVLELSGGRDAEVSILYAECYEHEPEPGGKRRKGVRDDSIGKQLYGFTDDYTVGGVSRSLNDEPERYQPFHRRAFRFIRLEAEAKGEPLTLRRFSYCRTGYPLRVAASFESSDETLNPLWPISVNTLRNCMHETYEDTPYYEQMGYEMDTRLQALFTYQISADDRLARKALYDFHSSLLPTGMLQSRYPAVSRQVIPGFALFWIMMVHDHYMHFADQALVRYYLPSIDAVLGWFERKREASGLAGRMPQAYWSFVDWTEEWRSRSGAPSAAKDGPLTVYNLMYADALVKSAELCELAGRRDTAAEYRSRAESVRGAVRSRCWSETRGMFRDGPEAEAYSQHAQIWAVLTGTVADAEARALMERTLSESGLAQTSIAMAYYLFRALAMTGLYDRTLKLWDVWRRQVDLHVTAWVEDPVLERSDCHAWGALPLHEFPAELLGVKPEKPGYAAIRIEPSTIGLSRAAGAAMTPHGPVRVEWTAHDGEFRLSVNGPDGVPAVVRLPDGSETRTDGLRELLLSCRMDAI